ncbi:transcription factor bHLH104-like [Primulina eburnea]|uniref:transcription factor bHLH104-like n=1 Tax=Primulina eburnea TaxID=1245227 RepID=UPI003C6BE805
MLVCQLIHQVVELHLKLVKFQERIHEKEDEKNELREEKLVLKERIKQKLKSITVQPIGVIPAYPPAYQAGANKMSVFPSYSFIPVWQYLSSSTCDKSQDHALRPPAA